MAEITDGPTEQEREAIRTRDMMKALRNEFEDGSRIEVTLKEGAVCYDDLKAATEFSRTCSYYVMNEKDKQGPGRTVIGYVAGFRSTGIDMDREGRSKVLTHFNRFSVDIDAIHSYNR